jgi:hypothetical protein
MSDRARERLESLKVKIAEKMAQEPGCPLNPVLTEEQVVYGSNRRGGFTRDAP